MSYRCFLRIRTVMIIESFFIVRRYRLLDDIITVNITFFFLRTYFNICSVTLHNTVRNNCCEHCSKNITFSFAKDTKLTCNVVRDILNATCIAYKHFLEMFLTRLLLKYNICIFLTSCISCLQDRHILGKVTGPDHPRRLTPFW